MPTEEKLARLEEKFTALENKYNDLLSKATFTLSEKVTGKVTNEAPQANSQVISLVGR